MASSRTWDSLLAIGFFSDGAPLLDSAGRLALGREIDLSAAFTVTYDEPNRRFFLSINTIDGLTLTDAAHGALGWSTDGTSLVEATFHHRLATGGPEGNPGFMSVGDKDRTDTMVTTPVVVVEDGSETFAPGEYGLVFPGAGTTQTIGPSNGSPWGLIMINNVRGGNTNIVSDDAAPVGGMTPYVMPDNTVTVFVPLPAQGGFGVLPVTI